METSKAKRRGALSILFFGVLFFSAGSVPAEVHNWAVELIVAATTPSEFLRDFQNLAAVTPGASDGFDIYDACIDEPISPNGTGGDDLNLSFYHPEFENPANGVTNRCSQDARAPFEAGGAWEWLLETNLIDTELVLTWNLQVEGAEVPPEYRVSIGGDMLESPIFLQNPDDPGSEVSQYRILSGTSPLAATFTLTVTNDPPPAPEGFQAEAGAESVRLSWDASSQPEDVNAFVIRYGTDSGVYPFEQVAGDVDFAVVEGLDGGTTYYFRLWARDRTGLEGEASPEEVSAQPSPLGDLDTSGWVDYVDLFLHSSQWYVPEPQVDYTWDDYFDQEDVLKLEANWHREL